MAQHSTPNDFRVIVIGGGHVGLVAAHFLSNASIDFVVLEQNDTIDAELGVVTGLSHQALHLMEQLGLSERLKAIGTCVAHHEVRTVKGKWCRKVGEEGMTRNHTTKAMYFDRSSLTRCLYNALSDADKARIMTGKRMAHIYTTDDGVVVTCADGSSHKGSIVIGADGTRSKTRDLMREMALREAKTENKNGGTLCKIQQQLKLPRSTTLTGAATNPQHPYSSKYRMVQCSSPLQPHQKPDQAREVHNRNIAIHSLNTQDSCYLSLFEYLPRRKRSHPTLHTHADQEIQTAFKKLSHLPIDTTTTLLTTFKFHDSATITQIEEGILPHWSHNGRVVLAGSACHTMAPALDPGLGFTNAVLDVASLVNQLHQHIHPTTDHSPKPPPIKSTTSRAKERESKRTNLEAAFVAYQASRMNPLKDDYEASRMGIRLQTWRTPIMWFMDRYNVNLAIPGTRKRRALERALGRDVL